MSSELNVIVVGAGAAGLAAAVRLGSYGLSVTVLDARHRIGGRIFTERGPDCKAPIELGAEFIHGRPPEIWKPLQERNIRITEVDGDGWCVRNGHLCKCNFFSQVEKFSKRWTTAPRMNRS